MSGSEDSFNKLINSFNSQIGKHFQSEYCGIGRMYEQKLVNLATYTVNETTPSQEKAFKKVKAIPIENTLIGDFLQEGKDYQFFDSQQILDSENDYIKLFKNQIVTSKSISNIILIGLYTVWENTKEPIGYINLINANDEYQELDKKFLTNFGKQLSNLFVSAFYRKSYLNKVKDDDFINSLREYGNNFDKILEKITKYLTDEFNLGIVSFRVPVINGKEEDAKNNSLFPLRYVYVDNDIKFHEEIKERYYFDKKVLNLSDLTYNIKFLENFPDKIYFDEKAKDNTFNTELGLNDLFSTKTNIVLPIWKKISHSDHDSDSNPYKKDLYGIFNLRPYKIENRDETKERLKYLSRHITHIINGVMSTKKYSQTISLQQEIEKLNYIKSSSFYDKIAQLFAKVMNAEICSVFMYDNRDNRLILKASTANKAWYKGEEITLSKIKYLEDIYYDLTEEDSVSVRVLLYGKTHLIFSTKYYKNYSSRFIEIPEHGEVSDYSLLFVPIKDNEGKLVGVIKCFGKIESPENLIHSFWDFDRETVEFVASLSSRFIGNAEFDSEKDNFVIQIVHEMLSPLTEILHKVNRFESLMQRTRPNNTEIENYNKRIKNNIFLNKQILLGLEDVAFEKVKDYLYKFEMENVHKLILDVVILLETKAHSDKQISIQTNISDLPYLKVDQYKIIQVFINLIRNAINYSYSGTKIEIYYQETEKSFKNSKYHIWHEIKIQNTGIGIHEREKVDIFKLYRRGSNADKLIPSGAGVGLYLVKKIMNAHNGYCIIRKLDKPTIISVLLPKE